MSNILIIKHGSLGDLIQANGAIADIKNSAFPKILHPVISEAFFNFINGVLPTSLIILSEKLFNFLSILSDRFFNYTTLWIITFDCKK